MTAPINGLAPKFNRVLSSVFKDNIAEKVIVKITNSCVILYYTIKTNIKDIHRKVLKNDYCDQCVFNITNDSTNIKATFSFDKVLEFFSLAAVKTTQHTLEVIKGMGVDEAVKTFINEINICRYGQKTSLLV
jgi:hypothetical protein